MNAFDPAMPGYEALRAALRPFCARRSAVVDRIGGEQGDDRSRAVELDWLVHIVDRQDGAVRSGASSA